MAGLLENTRPRQRSNLYLADSYVFRVGFLFLLVEDPSSFSIWIVLDSIWIWLWIDGDSALLARGGWRRGHKGRTKKSAVDRNLILFNIRVESRDASDFNFEAEGVFGVNTYFLKSRSCQPGHPAATTAQLGARSPISAVV